MADFPKDLRKIIEKHLRRIGYRNIHYKTAMAKAHKGFGKWECSKCGSFGSRENLHGDHIQPVTNPDTGFVDWNSHMERLFLGEIQPLCKPCHAAKSETENVVRRKNRSKKVRGNNGFEEV